MATVFRSAVVGYGYIGKRHALIVNQSPNWELTAIADPDPSALQAAQKDFINLPVYPSLSELLQSTSKPDLVHICTPNGTHASLTVEALRAGCHVLVEKPMALTVNEAILMNYETKKAGKNLYCMLQNRLSPVSAELKKIISGKYLGKIFFTEVNCFWNRDERYYLPGSWRGTLELDGGPLFTQFSHFIDILIWTLGIPECKGAILQNIRRLTPLEDTGSVRFSVGKMNGLLNYSTAVWRQNFESSLKILGEKGTVHIGGQYMNEFLYCDIENYTLPDLTDTAPQNVYPGYSGSADRHALVLEEIRKHLSGNRSAAVVFGTEGLETVRFINDIYRYRR